MLGWKSEAAVGYGVVELGGVLLDMAFGDHEVEGRDIL